MGDSFQNFLKQLGENISEEELTALAAACQDVIPNEERERIHKQRELFDYMEKIGKLGCGKDFRPLSRHQATCLKK